MKNLILLLPLLLLGLSSCSSEFTKCSGDDACLSVKALNKRASKLKSPTLLAVENSYESSTEIGNFVTTAIQKANNLDFAFLPAAYFHKMKAVIEVKPGMTQAEIDKVLEHFPRGPNNQLLFGTMKGEKLKTFIRQRSRETYNKELETAGLWYSLTYQGGFLTAENFSVNGRYQLNDDEYYRIAISDDFFFGSAFPGYKFRNNFNFHFRRERYQGYINKSIEKYLKSIKSDNTRLPYWPEKRAVVKDVMGEDVGFKRISQIQGLTHKSPLVAKRVTTRGVVTAVGSDQWYPRYLDVYIQSTTPDSDPRTSEGLHLVITTNNVFLQLGDEIEVSGLVIEDLRSNNIGETNLRVATEPKVLSRGNALPEAQILGPNGRKIPNKRISTFVGPLMRKDLLNLEDGIDFWESMEGMRIAMDDLKIVGLRGGGEDLVDLGNRFYLNLQVIAKGTSQSELETVGGGVRIDVNGEDFKSSDFNPEIVTLTTNHLSRGIQVEKSNGDYYYYNVGDEIPGRTEGVLTYQRNLFGGGEFALVTPEPQKSLSYRSIKSKGFVPVEERGTTRFLDKRNEVTFATFNLENLPGNRPDRIEVVGNVIARNLQCPDVMNLVEIQDNNGISFRGSANADKTLHKLLGIVQSQCSHKNYDFANIDPFLQAEGGQPGGNIRVAMMYNKNKLSYTKRNDGSIGSQALVGTGGLLTSNPGRIFPADPVFARTRRSVVIEFDVLSKPGEKVYVIGNHLNSKLGDIDFWGNVQPARPGSDDKRRHRTEKINDFIRWVEQENPKANIVVLGDFNALAEEESMNVLTGQGKQLRNMIFTLPPGDRHTTNHNGNSQSLDYVFVNHKMFEKCAESEVLHINSDYMGRVSDHDPVTLKACF